jgi:hypothetical protein
MLGEEVSLAGCLLARDQISWGWRNQPFPAFGIGAAARVLNSAGDSLKILCGIVRSSVCKVTGFSPSFLSTRLNSLHRPCAVAGCIRLS